MSIATLFLGINWLAVVLLSLLGFVLGALWHMPLLFGRIWARETAMAADRKLHPLMVFGFSGLLHLVAVVGLAIFIGPQVDGTLGLVWGLVVAFFWVLPPMGVTYLFAGRSFALFAIDAGFYVVFYAVSGLVIGLWH